MFGQVLLCYENDYFTSAWQSAGNPLATIENVNIVDVPSVLSGNTVGSALLAGLGECWDG